MIAHYVNRKRGIVRCYTFIKDLIYDDLSVNGFVKH